MKTAVVRWATIALTLWAATAAHAATLRIATAGDAGTLDPQALNAGSTTIVTRQIYEALVARDESMRKAPGLALSWSLEEPTRWRFRLRPGVRFHDGSRFDETDVVFSLKRALEPTSDFKLFAAGIRDVKAVGELQVDVLTDGPDPLLPDKLTRLFILDAEWAARHAVQKPQNFRGREETYAVRQANGTGPYRLVRREPDSKTELARFEGWWGKTSGNVDRVIYLPIASEATRVSALLAGDVDFILDVPPQMLPALQRDARVRVLIGPENRTIFLAMDQQRGELASSNAKGNPFKDERVRRAVYQAIDIDALHRQTMRGQSVPTGSMWAPSIAGYAQDDDVRLPLDHAASRRLLAEAGYPDGFSVTLDCPNNRYVNDEAVCVALAAMLARVGIVVRVNAQPFSTFAAAVQRRESNFYLLGWASPTFDALFTLQALMRSTGSGADGSNNFSGYSNAAVDRLIDSVKTETDPARRLASIRQAHRIHNAEVGHIPLHHQVIAWAVRAGIDAALQPENQVEIKTITIKNQR